MGGNRKRTALLETTKRQLKATLAAVFLSQYPEQRSRDIPG